MTSGLEAPPRNSLTLRNLSKTYGTTRALDSLFLQVRPGEIHALLGGNGSGKSTTIKILAGVERADVGGEIRVRDGDSVGVSEWSPTRAHEGGLRFVHQHAAVFPDLTVAENVAIGAGFPRGFGGRIDWRSLHRRTAELLERYGIDASPTTPVKALRAADRSRVAIVRALQDSDADEGGILVLDEPTAALPDAEVQALLSALRRYAEAGQTILYVSHRLDEVLDVADRVTVLRDGRQVDTVEAAGLTEERLIELIVGRPLERVFPPAQPVSEDVARLVVRGLVGGPLRGVDFELRRGEVLGVAGLLGSGRSELLRMLFGAFPVDGGQITLDGTAYRPTNPGAAIDRGVAYVPEDRQFEGLFAGQSVRHNLTGGDGKTYYRRLLFRHGEERRDSARAVSDFLVRLSDDRQPVDTLSGGNQQKIVLARWLRRRPKVLLLDEPTQGVDVAARAEIYELVRRATTAGTSVLLVVSEPEELAHASDRVLVLRGGRITAAVDAPVDAHRLIQLMNTDEEQQ